ncbi:MAG TPA: methyltransferase domain-containing protein, partial [Humibacillus xanthopallidus]|nr:methyltransferase domain-containing protein [Humibacillus xanthopallidus]
GLGITVLAATRRQYRRSVSFEVAADAYNRFMGRYSGPLSSDFANWAGVRAGERALDVGCGPGALTRVLIERLGVDAVSAVDPSPPFVAALRQAFPTLDVQQAVAERLPYPDDLFDHTLAQLVVHFMTDPVGGLQEMGRVTLPGGTVSACVWDFGGERGPISLLWRAARDLDPGVVDENDLPGAREGDLERLFHAAGLARVERGELTVSVHHEGFEQWWEPYTLGVGPAGAYVVGLDEEQRTALRDHCRELLPDGSFDVTSQVWAVRARA